MLLENKVMLVAPGRNINHVFWSRSTIRNKRRLKNSHNYFSASNDRAIPGSTIRLFPMRKKYSSKIGTSSQKVTENLKNKNNHTFSCISVWKWTFACISDPILITSGNASLRRLPYKNEKIFPTIQKHRLTTVENLSRSLRSVLMNMNESTQF